MRELEPSGVDLLLTYLNEQNISFRFAEMVVLKALGVFGLVLLEGGLVLSQLSKAESTELHHHEPFASYCTVRKATWLVLTFGVPCGRVIALLNELLVRDLYLTSIVEDEELSDFVVNKEPDK